MLLYIITDILQVPWLFKNLSFVALIKPYKIEVYFIKAIDRTFCRFTGEITYLECWENTRRFSKSLASGSWFTKFSRVLPTSQGGYYADEPNERAFNPSIFFKFANCVRSILSDDLKLFKQTMNYSRNLRLVVTNRKPQKCTLC